VYIVYVCVCLRGLYMRMFLTVFMYFFLTRTVNGVLMHCASLMGGLALDLGWWHTRQIHEYVYTHPLTHTHTNKVDRRSKTGHRFGAHYEYQDSQVLNSQAVSLRCQCTQTPAHTDKCAHMHI